jgi:hypothetical protein
MELVLISIVIVLIIILVYWTGGKYGQYNTVRVAGCATCNKYPVHVEHMDQKAASGLIEKIVGRSCKLIKHLRGKYQPGVESLDPNSNGRIDIIPGSDMSLHDPVTDEIVETSEEIRERVKQLITNFNPRDIREISPLNGEGLTSYTENKKSLVLCLRRKTPDASGNYPLHDINIMMFVTIHEMTHMMNDSWGHPMDFWELFRFMLENAVEAGVYVPVNYRTDPIIYCGLRIDHNPYFVK